MVQKKDVKDFVMFDGNTAAANIAYEFSEVAAIYPITPSSAMGEIVDVWSSKLRKNLFGEPLKVVEMQSEAGAAGAIHGALSAGAFTTTFTASQGLLLMLPNMFKIAGEMLPTVFHVAARSLSYQSLSIFGDHSDVMAVRGTGFALVCAGSVQEVQDLAVISHLSTLQSRIPFLNFFDGFRTSHEIQKIESIDASILHDLLDFEAVSRFKDNALRPEKPVAKVGAQNPDVYFQGRETSNLYYDALPGIIKKNMSSFFEKTGRKYDLFEYFGAVDAEKIIVMMGSGAETVHETVDFLVGKGEKLGLVKIRLYRPFSVEHFINVIPSSVKKICVLDRTKESGSVGEPLFVDIVSAINKSKFKDVFVIGGRYGLSSKEFTPSMVNAVFKHLSNNGFSGFTVGIDDDVSHKSLKVDELVLTEHKGVVRCKFWGYGSDGTISANKNAIKIIGEATDLFVQAYFSYDSKKSGGVTVSHLRFGPDKIRSQYLLVESDFVALHKTSYIGRYDILRGLKKNGVFLINSNLAPENVFESFTKDMQQHILNNNIKVFCIDASRIANEAGLKNKINSVMQTAFFKVCNIMDFDKSVSLMKQHIEQQFLSKGKEIVEMNWRCIDLALNQVFEVVVPSSLDNIKCVEKIVLVKDDAPLFVREVIEPIMRFEGDNIPVSKMPLDGSVVTGTTKFEKRGVALEVPRWISEHCIQCGICSFVCPHSAIRVKQINNDSLKDAPSSFNVLKSTTKNDDNLKFKVQVYPEDCIGCKVCVDACPVKNKALEMKPLDEERSRNENANAEFFDELPCIITGTDSSSIKGSQLMDTYFEFSGACGGCGETPYVKLATQLFGDRMVIANATGCSSIFGGTFPTIPYTVDKQGKGPAWANSLFEDNAEYGFGMRTAIDANRSLLKYNVERLLSTGTTVELTDSLKKALGSWDDINVMKQIYVDIQKNLPNALASVYGESEKYLKQVVALKDYFVDKSLWIFGGDGWAYDIGFGGLDHVLAQGKNVNVLVLDTEVYSNTGGQASKATPRGATAKFASSGKTLPKKNLGLMMMSYGYVYVAHINMSADRAHALKVLLEAEKYNGPSLIIAYAPCIAHGYNMGDREVHGKMASTSGYWPLYRFNPDTGFSLDSPSVSSDFKDFVMGENRYASLFRTLPETANNLFELAKKDLEFRNNVFKHLSDDSDKDKEEKK